ncbi:exosporium protein C [Alicyclobacillus dauci]|uniref:Exosporium protein C n=1 Tax=Alicyclobacillus dauci TaxID=1475485 RepID=A0ABY6Z1J6_9BACL|nr:exosporium protein C [Alicyclobacillus dauci]WAH36231.1 exosporium protein C [Alicyclobacillus dauci]
MARVIDYNAKQPRRRFNLSRATTIPHSPTRLRLARIRLNTGSSSNMSRNRVELIGTVGVRGVTGISQLLFRIFRNGTEIFNTRQGVESAGSERNYTVTFQAIDRNVSGTHTYTLTVENLTSGTTAQVVGPVSFSGLSIRRSRTTSS